MKHNMIRITLLLLLAGILGMVSVSAAYQNDGTTQPDITYAIDWYTVDGGGGSSTGTGYNVAGTIGQYDAGMSAGGPYRLAGGFWGHTVRVRQVYLPALRR